jgi:hypothetical protein
MKLSLLSMLLLAIGANAQIVINEINYNDAVGFETQDWIELYNNGNSNVDISNWVFKDNDDLHEFIIPNGTIMGPDTYLVLAQTLADFQTFHPTVSPVLGDFTFGLSGLGELIRLFDDNGTIVDQVEYDDEAPWPTEPNGNGPTLELRNPDLDNALAASWNSSIPPDGEHGTPGAINSTFLLGTVDIKPTVFSISPNPLRSESTILISNSTGPVQLLIYDVYGRKVQTKETKTNSLTLQKEHLSSGIYMLVLETNQGAMVQKQKLIID